jgi:hypothetical protein
VVLAERERTKQRLEKLDAERKRQTKERASLKKEKKALADKVCQAEEKLKAAEARSANTKSINTAKEALELAQEALLAANEKVVTPINTADDNDDYFNDLVYSQSPAESLALMTEDIKCFAKGFFSNAAERLYDIPLIDSFSLLNPLARTRNAGRAKEFMEALFKAGFEFRGVDINTLIRGARDWLTSDVQDFKIGDSIVEYFQRLVRTSVNNTEFYRFALDILPFLPATVICEGYFSKVNEVISPGRAGGMGALYPRACMLVNDCSLGIDRGEAGCVKSDSFGGENVWKKFTRHS